MEGEHWNGTGCEKCPVEHYKDVVGNNVTCQMCPDDETAPDVGHTKCGECEKTAESVLEMNQSISTYTLRVVTKQV